MHDGTRTGVLAVAALVAGLACAVAAVQACSIAASALLYPARSISRHPAPPGCEERAYQADDVVLDGWSCRTDGTHRGSVVYLHGIADNRGSARGVIPRFSRRGFDVIAYDSRRHGTSGGNACTYGFLEKNDLRAVIDTLRPGPVVLIGTSLGAAVALQAAALDSRITAVVAAEVFSDLRTIATERAPFLLPDAVISRAFRTAEERGGFAVDAVSPVEAARTLRIPVLLIHGAADRETTPDHSRRVHAALAGPRRLIVLPGVGHNQSLSSGEVWSEIERWVESAIRPAGVNSPRINQRH